MPIDLDDLADTMGPWSAYPMNDDGTWRIEECVARGRSGPSILVYTGIVNTLCLMHEGSITYLDVTPPISLDEIAEEIADQVLAEDNYAICFDCLQVREVWLRCEGDPYCEADGARHVMDCRHCSDDEG
jgi:hypothetical protein